MDKINPPAQLKGLGKHPDELTVQKSKPLLSLWKSDLSLASLKILDAYLSRINSFNPDQRTVVFKKREIESLLGVTKINKQFLEERLKNLLQPVELEKDNAKKIKLIPLFEESEAEQQDDGTWYITLTCTNVAMKYFFNIETVGYLRYKLKSIIHITSRYSYVMFTYLESNRYRKSWIESIDTLQYIMNCDEDEMYKEFKYFNQRILKRCHKELLEKTDLRYTYTPVKNGRKVTGIQFTIETLKDLIEKETPEPDYDLMYEQLQNSEYTIDKMMYDACDNEYDTSEMEIIMSIISTKELKPHPYDAYDSSQSFAKYHYLHKMHCILNSESEKKERQGKPITNRFKYFKTMLENDNT